LIRDGMKSFEIIRVQAGAVSILSGMFLFVYTGGLTWTLLQHRALTFLLIQSFLQPVRIKPLQPSD
jgi:hypothetical protein